MFTKPVPSRPRTVVASRRIKPKPILALSFVVFLWGRMTPRNRSILVVIGAIVFLLAYHGLRTPSEVELQQAAEQARQDQATRNYIRSLVDMCSQSSRARDYWTVSERSSWTTRCVSRIRGGASILSVLATD